MPQHRLSTEDRNTILQGYKLRLSGADIQLLLNSQRTYQDAISLSCVYKYIAEIKAAGIIPLSPSHLMQIATDSTCIPQFFDTYDTVVRPTPTSHPLDNVEEFA